MEVHRVEVLVIDGQANHREYEVPELVHRPTCNVHRDAPGRLSRRPPIEQNGHVRGSLSADFQGERVVFDWLDWFDRLMDLLKER